MFVCVVLQTMVFIYPSPRVYKPNYVSNAVT